ncbi:hypothetical protein [Billgrantia endophytica]|uniref:Uncharacterized protein n=1 Tax=Billgrantia endophytica TaxID=2033802 RepID=A0A2N7TUD9_9GAMM|nr:hypothetical protein [Halomonas endophytica]PMR71809.1 hypothetical protein C1H69_23020 [Halomonas endophytica]
MRNLTKTALATALIAISATALAEDRQIHMSFIEATGHDRQLVINHDTHGYPTDANELTAILEAQGATIEARYGLQMPSEPGVPETINRTSIHNVGGDIVDRGLEYSIMTSDAYPGGYDVHYSVSHSGIADIVVEDGIIVPVMDAKHLTETFNVEEGYDFNHTATYRIKDMDDEGFFMPKRVYVVINVE